MFAFVGVGTYRYYAIIDNKKSMLPCWGMWKEEVDDEGNIRCSARKNLCREDAETENAHLQAQKVCPVGLAGGKSADRE
jgi:hypothetical protein